MQAPVAVHPSLRAAPPARSATTTALAALGGLFALGFAVLALEYPLALAAGRPAWVSLILAALVAPEFTLAPDAMTVRLARSYNEVLPRMSIHMALGGLALGLGAAQFIPALRRRHPRVHRACGAAVVLAVLASLAGAVGFLVYIPMHQGSSGAAFHLGLWALAGLTLFALTQAGLALWARDHRAHMVWMAVMFACLATAPMLRVGWVGLAWLSGGNLERVNLASGGLVLSATLWIMALWLAQVGDRDLPGRAAAASRWPAWLVVALSAAAAGVTLHEGLAAPWGLDLLARWRPTQELLPRMQAAAWAAMALLALAQVPAAWRAFLRGQRPGPGVALAGAGLAVGAIAMGLARDTHELAGFALAVFWVGYGVLTGVLLALAGIQPRNSLGRNAWGLQWLFLLWLPAQWPLGVLAASWLGASAAESVMVAQVVGIGGLGAAALATAFGAPLRLRPPPRVTLIPM